MAFFSIFCRNTQQHTDQIAHSVERIINERLAEVSERLRRIEIKQKETSLQLEGIDDFLHNNGNETVLVDALIALADTIGDFFYYAVAAAPSPLFDQAQMMWNAVKNAAGTAGLEIIDAENEPFDFRLHSAESTDQDDGMPNGYVIKTLKCGYVYREKVIRRAAVIVNAIVNTKEGT